MTISVSVASQDASPRRGESLGQNAQTRTIPSLRRSIRADLKAEPKRPTSSRKATLQATAEGREKIAAARNSLSKALAAHSIAPVAQLRLRAGLSQKELCEKTGLPQPHLSRLENGHVPMPEVSTLKKLADALGITLDEVTAAFTAQAVA